MGRDPTKPPEHIPFTVLIHELARKYNKLPYDIKQIPWSEIKEMIDVSNIRHDFLGT